MGNIWFPPFYVSVDPLVGGCLPSRQATLSLPESYQTKLSPSCQRDCNKADLKILWAIDFGFRQLSRQRLSEGAGHPWRGSP
jgi:hypothetical protein